MHLAVVRTVHRQCCAYAIVALGGVIGCGGDNAEVGRGPVPSGPKTAPWFVAATAESGLQFVHSLSETNDYFMPEIFGSGAAILDFDNDGFLDVYFIQNGGGPATSPNQLFRQTADGEFVNVSKGSGLDVQGQGMGAAVGDLNNDGWCDVLVTEYGGIRLFSNSRDGTFSEVTEEAGLSNPAWATSAAFFDYDRDGWLDIVVANYVDYSETQKCASDGGLQRYCGPSGFPPTVAKIFRNLGRDATTEGSRMAFADETVNSGLATCPGPGLGVVCADFDGDRWPDIFFADDGAPNRLMINQRDGTFLDEAVRRGIALNAMGDTQANMGIALGDANQDGLFDIFVTHLHTEYHALWSQQSVGFFQDRTAANRLSKTQWRGTAFGTLFGDFDNDGDCDLAIANGAVDRVSNAEVQQTLGEFWSNYAQRNQLLENEGDGKFRDVSKANDPFCKAAEISRGLASADFDNDGRLDLLVMNTASAAKLYRNVSPSDGNWLIVRAIEPEHGGRDAYGAVVTVYSGGKMQRRWLNPAYSFLCSNDPRCHFGLGAATDADRIEVVWPDGSEEMFGRQSAGQIVRLEKGTGSDAGSVSESSIVK